MKTWWNDEHGGQTAPIPGWGKVCPPFLLPCPTCGSRKEPRSDRTYCPYCRGTGWTEPENKHLFFRWMLQGTGAYPPGNNDRGIEKPVDYLLRMTPKFIVAPEGDFLFIMSGDPAVLPLDGVICHRGRWDELTELPDAEFDAELVQWAARPIAPPV